MVFKVDLGIHYFIFRDTLRKARKHVPQPTDDKLRYDAAETVPFLFNLASNMTFFCDNSL